MSDQAFETERMILRRFTLDDAESFYRLGSIPEVVRYAGNKLYPSLDVARDFLQRGILNDYQTRGFGRLACFLKETAAFVGWSGIKFVAEVNAEELGYSFLPEYWGKGLATEAGRANVAFARDALGLKKLIGLVHPDNLASANVLQKLGFAVERKLAVSFVEGVEVDVFARQI